MLNNFYRKVLYLTSSVLSNENSETSIDKACSHLLDKPLDCTIEVMEKFIPWLLAELEKRSWRPADLAHRAGLSTGSLSNVLSGNRKAGPDICKAIARACNEPPEKVFRLAGLLPPLPGEEDELLNEVTETFKRLSPEMRREVLAYALWQLGRQQPDSSAPPDTGGDA